MVVARHSTIGGNDSLEDQRTEDNHHAATRDGRALSDPKPLCPSCGLVMERPHGSDADCIAALRDEIAVRKGSTSR